MRNLIKGLLVALFLAGCGLVGVLLVGCGSEAPTERELTNKIGSIDDTIGAEVNRSRKYLFERGIRELRYGDQDTTSKVDQNGELIEKNSNRIDVINQLLDLLQMDLAEVTKEFITIVEVTEVTNVTEVTEVNNVTEVTEVIDHEAITVLFEAIADLQQNIDEIRATSPTLTEIETLRDAIDSLESMVNELRCKKLRKKKKSECLKKGK